MENAVHVLSCGIGVRESLHTEQNILVNFLARFTHDFFIVFLLNFLIYSKYFAIILQIAARQVEKDKKRHMKLQPESISPKGIRRMKIPLREH